MPCRMELAKNRLSALIDMNDPEAVMAEVRSLVSILFPSFDFTGLNTAFDDIKRLYRGSYPGYRPCNTEYHNLQHTTDCFLAMARLIHGAMIQEEKFSLENVSLGLMASLFHDTGYIQTNDDSEGTGAKYTLVHVQRSIDFMTSFFKARSYPNRYIHDGTDMLKCTGLNVNIHEIDFTSSETKMLGQMLGTADLLGQMADRTYLEKLLFLFHEFREGAVPIYSSEIEFLCKTELFFKMTHERFDGDLGGVRRYMIPHFKSRWNIDADLYATAIQRNQEYLKRILEKPENGHRQYLRRGNVVLKLKKRGL
ncbi:MAG: hypothetical protein AB1659_03600 [Thermodesulfobacteriota bacterium]